MNLIADYIAKGIDYQQFINLTEDLLEQNTTTDKKQDKELLNYSKINLARMHRIRKQVELLPESIQGLKRKKGNYTFVVLTEGWCGDAAQVLPIIRKIEQVSDNITVKILLREENPELMDAYLTNGTRSIPKVIILKEGRIIGDWGPRPKELMELTAKFKSDDSYSKEQFSMDVQTWFNKDKGKVIQKEILELL